MFSTAAITLAGAFVAVALWETVRPARSLTVSLVRRWFGNFAVYALGALVAWCFPVVLLSGGAELAAEHGWGLLNLLGLPDAAAIAIGIVALDGCNYGIHRLMHVASPLWRIHALHHADTDLDLTTALRHHPLEVVVKLLLDVAIVVVLGIPAAAVVIYRGAVTAVQLVQHGNIELPAGLRWLGHVIVTPELHRLHHSVRLDESNANFSELSSIWDRLFGTYRDAPVGTLHFGLAAFPGLASQRLDRMLMFPALVRPAPSNATAG